MNNRNLPRRVAIAVMAGGAMLAGALAACAQSPFQYMTPIEQGAPGSAAPASPSPATNQSQTFQDLLRAAQRGDVVAQNRVATTYILEYLKAPVAQKPALATEANKWARATAERGNQYGETNLGFIYENGIGVPVNQPEALRLYRLAADQGNAVAQSAAGRMYYTGAGVPQDYAEAQRYLQKAAAQNNADAQNLIGVTYFSGHGVPKDLPEAAKWYRRAASAGQTAAQTNLAYMYANGVAMPQSPVLAYFWYNLAAARATGTVQANAVKGRNTMVARLSPQEIERAQAAARDWKPAANAADVVEASLKGDATTPSGQVPAVAGGAAAAGRHVQSSGTGFVITKLGHVLTNHHVINGCAEVRARVPANPPIIGDVVASDPQNDLAVVKLATPLPSVAAFRSGQPLRQGDSVVVYGFPLGDALAAEGNLTAGNISALAGLANDSRQLQISAPVQPGNSGGPLVDTNGNVVGVIVAKLNALVMMKFTGDVPQNVNFAIKAGVAESFLEANSIEYQTAPASTQRLPLPDVGERAKRFTVKIECLR